MKQLQLNSKTLGVVDVPEGQRCFGLYSYGLVMKLMWNEMIEPGKFKQREIIFKQREIILDPGQWSILGRLDSITKEQAAEIRSHGITGNPLVLLLNEKV